MLHNLLKFQKSSEALHTHCTNSTASMVKATCRLWHKHFLTTTLKLTIIIITDIFSKPTILKCCPISNLISISFDPCALQTQTLCSMFLGGNRTLLVSGGTSNGSLACKPMMPKPSPTKQSVSMLSNTQYSLLIMLQQQLLFQQFLSISTNSHPSCSSQTS